MNQLANQRDGLAKELKTEIFEFLSKSTIHGLPNIIISKHLIIKLMWLLLTILSSACCTYFIIKGVNEYLQYNVTTEVRIINEHEITCPTITICNENFFTTKKSVDYLRRIIKENNLINLFDDNEFLLNKSINGTEKMNLITKLIDLGYSYIRNGQMNDSITKELSLSIDDMIISCSFAGSSCDLENDFVWFFNYYYGNCYRFNSKIDQLKKLATPGRYNGLSFEMYVGLPDQLDKLTSQKGILIFINSINDYVLSYIQNGIDIPTNQETNILLRKSVYNQMAYPYSNCTNDQDILKKIDRNFYESILKHNFTYTKNDCMDYCYQKHLSFYCKCNDYSSGFFIENYTSCFTQEQNECLNEFYYKIFTNFSFIEANCLDICPLECVKTQYDPYISSLVYPTNLIRDLLRDDESLIKKFSNQTNFVNDLEKNILKVTIYYDTLSYIKYEESPNMNFVDLISNIGGTFGLFLGIFFTKKLFY